MNATMQLNQSVEGGVPSSQYSGLSKTFLVLKTPLTLS